MANTTDEQRTDPDFLHFSQEYAQAVDAWEAIEHQASTLVALGSSEELRVFVSQFIHMARTASEEAAARDVPHFVAWFDELVRKAEALRARMEE